MFFTLSCKLGNLIKNKFHELLTLGFSKLAISENETWFGVLPMITLKRQDL